MFDLRLLPPLDIERVDSPSGRKYRLPDGTEFPSVTTILDSAYDKSDIETWKIKIGQEKAKQIFEIAKQRGTALHGNLEKYVRGETGFMRGQMPICQEDFRNMKELLDENVRTIYGIEFPLFSRTLKSAGTTDLICDWNNTLSIVDYKNSRRSKNPEWIENYFVQSAAYGMMVNENFGTAIDQIVIIVLPESAKPETFIRTVSQFKEKIDEIFINRASVPLTAFA